MGSEELTRLKSLGHEAFCEGRLAEATRFYVEAMEVPARVDCENTEKDNSRFPQRTEAHSGIADYIRKVLHDADEAILWAPQLPEGYLRKASALILQNQWCRARQVYNEGIEKCEDQIELKLSLDRLDEVEKMIKAGMETVPR